MEIDTSQISSKSVYHLMTQTLAPRPIAWVLSDNGNGSFNLAPFSYFNGVSSRPPLCMFSVGKKSNGAPKDTLRNIQERDHFVIHIPHADMARQVSQTGTDLAANVSELDQYGIETDQRPGWPLPIVRGSAVAYLCRLEKIIEVGDVPQGVVFGRIEKIYMADQFVQKNGKEILFDAAKANILARLGGVDFCTLGDIISVPKEEK